MYSDRRGNGQKPPWTKPSSQKTPGWNPPEKNPREQLRENLYRGLLSGFLVLGQVGLLKIGGFEMCDVLLGVPGCVTKCDRGEGRLKLAKNSMTYLMDGPFGLERKHPELFSTTSHWSRRTKNLIAWFLPLRKTPINIIYLGSYTDNRTINTIHRQRLGLRFWGTKSHGFWGMGGKNVFKPRVLSAFRLALIKCLQCLWTNSNETIGNFLLNTVTLVHSTGASSC